VCLVARSKPKTDYYLEQERDTCVSWLAKEREREREREQERTVAKQTRGPESTSQCRGIHAPRGQWVLSLSIHPTVRPTIHPPIRPSIHQSTLSFVHASTARVVSGRSKHAHSLSVAQKLGVFASNKIVSTARGRQHPAPEPGGPWHIEPGNW
jgi:hypothetical protein